MKTAAITGPPGSGKTTLWTALSGGVDASGDTAIVEVPDERVDVLAELHDKDKKAYVQLALVDAHSPGRTGPQAMAKLREADALAVCIGSFAGADPADGLRDWTQELILADLAPIEATLERARKEREAASVVETMSKAKEILESGGGLASGDWQPVDLGNLASIAPLTLKPMIGVINVDESQLTLDAPDGTIVVAAALENETVGLDPHEAKELLSTYGVGERGAELLIRELYGALDLITFLTVGEKEVRAWEVPGGSTAPQAAGAVHTDMERGFIKAEVCDFETVEAKGGWDSARSEGGVRVEGKDYVIQEGDVVLFRFAV